MLCIEGKLFWRGAGERNKRFLQRNLRTHNQRLHKLVTRNDYLIVGKGV